MPTAHSWASALGTADTTETDSVRRAKAKSLGALLMQQAGDTTTPVYSTGAGIAKLGAGFVGGVMNGLDQRQQDEATRRANLVMADMLRNGVGAAPAVSAPSASSSGSAPAPAGYNPAGKMPSFSSMPMAQGLKPHETAFLNAIAAPESGGRYDIRYSPSGGKTFSDLSRHPAVFEPGPAGPSSAAGCYQFTKTTWDRMGGGSFDPENQDRRALQLAREDYGRKTGRDLDADLSTGGFTPQIASALGSTWAGFKDNPSKAVAAYQSTLAKVGAGRTAQADMPAPGARETSLTGEGRPDVGFYIPGAEQSPASPPVDPARPGAPPPGMFAPLSGAAPEQSGAPSVREALQRATAQVMGPDGGTDPLGNVTGFGDAAAPAPMPPAAAQPPAPASAPFADLSGSVDGGRPSMTQSAEPGRPGAPPPGVFAPLSGVPSTREALQRATAQVMGQDNGTNPMADPSLFAPQRQAVPSEVQQVDGPTVGAFTGPVFDPSGRAQVPLPPPRPTGLDGGPGIDPNNPQTRAQISAAVAASPTQPTSYDPSRVRMDMTVVPGQAPYDPRTTMASTAPPPLPPGQDPRADMPAPGAREAMLSLPPQSAGSGSLGRGLISSQPNAS